MPEQVMQDIEKTIAELNVKLRNGADITIKDVLWPMLAIANDVRLLANVHVDCPARNWYNTWSKWANVALGGLLVALFYFLVNLALQHGFVIPKP
jgi:hypothetical protein